jgi:hypothetical protein
LIGRAILIPSRFDRDHRSMITGIVIAVHCGLEIQVLGFGRVEA